MVPNLIDDKEILTLDEDFEDDDGDRTIIQGIKNLKSKLENRQASLMVISGSAAGKMFRVAEGTMNIGRAKDCEIVLADDGISRRHCRIECNMEGDVFISDLGSTNGTYFDGTPITRHLLQDGDKIQVGSTTIIKFSYQDSIEEAFHQNQYEQATRDVMTGIFYNNRYL